MKYSVIDLQRELIESYQKYRKDYLKYARKIKEIAEEFFKENLLKVIVFGSTVKGNFKPWSDIDVAIILKERVNEIEIAKFIGKINKLFGIHPFEIHVIPLKFWEEWYSKFIKKDWVEV